MDRLSEPPVWDGIAEDNEHLGKLIGGDSPSDFMDRVAEALLKEAVPTKEQLFANVEPIVESLL